ncbi:RBPJ-interacting and tubulin-associated protein 1 isoform X2 [Ascaphus truei]
MSLDLSITGHRASFPQHKSRSAYRFKAANSYVDETLFGSSGGRTDPTQMWSKAAPGQTPLLWSPGESKGTNNSASCRADCSPAGTPRRKIQYRVKSRSPSYCDESLFGQKLEDCSWDAPWVKKEDVVKLRPLLWSPTAMPRPQRSKPKTKPLPLRAVHPPEVSDSVLGVRKGAGDFWKPPESDSDSGGRSPRCAKPLRASGTQRSTPRRETARSVSWSGRESARRGSGTAHERPPWK